MNCAEVRRRLSAYIDNELDKEARDAVAVHLEQCASCREDLASLAKTVKMVRSLSRIPWTGPREGGERKNRPRSDA